MNEIRKKLLKIGTINNNAVPNHIQILEKFARDDQELAIYFHKKSYLNCRNSILYIKCPMNQFNNFKYF